MALRGVIGNALAKGPAPPAGVTGTAGSPPAAGAGNVPAPVLGQLPVGPPGGGAGKHQGQKRFQISAREPSCFARFGNFQIFVEVVGKLTDLRQSSGISLEDRV